MRDLDLSPEQEGVLYEICRWRESNPYGDRQILSLGGYAGTGKTTLIAHLIAKWDDIAVGALCGKAAHVLRTKGVDAKTLHSMIYLPFENAEGKVCYRKRNYLPDVRTIIADEASMIDEFLLEDLKSFDLPILAVGDHGQLEPVGKSPNLMKEPHLRLETIHRQAKDNPIIRLATAFREGRHTPHWTDPKGRLTLTSSRHFWDLVRPGVQIICGFNKTRHAVNQNVRKQLGHTDMIQPGERLICLKNNKRLGVFNGQQFEVTGILGETRRYIEVEVETDDLQQMALRCLKRQFGVEVLTDYKPKDVVLCDYAYAITAHKAQGSEYGDVLVYEEVARSWDARRWRYTAATRAKDRLTYCA